MNRKCSSTKILDVELLGDLATNIAEEIIFMEEGEIVRRQTEDKRLTLSPLE